MGRIDRFLLVLGLVGLAGVLLGCEQDFDPSSKLSTLRVLAVPADQPYPKPGATVKLQMLVYDGKSPADQPRPIQVLWIAGCFDPYGDLYYNCYPQLGALLAKGTSDPSLAKLIGTGTTFSVDVPQDIISRKPSNPAADKPYGVTYVFFVACAGTIVPLQVQGSDAMPFACHDAQGNALGADDFVPGYLSLYSYEDRTNANPILKGFRINDVSLPDTEPVPDTHVPGCGANGCPDVAIKAEIDPASAEIDPGAVDPSGQQLTEQMWVDYYASDGTLSKSARLVNDATKGWNEDNGVSWTPPASGKIAYLFTVVHDNRGGVAWAKRRVVTD